MKSRPWLLLIASLAGGFASAGPLDAARTKFEEERKLISQAPKLDAWPLEASFRQNETNAWWLAAFDANFRLPILNYLEKLPRGKALAFPRPPEWYAAPVFVEGDKARLLSGALKELVAAAKAFSFPLALKTEPFAEGGEGRVAFSAEKTPLPARLLEPNRAARVTPLVGLVQEGGACQPPKETVRLQGAPVGPGRFAVLLLRERAKDTAAGRAKLALLPGLDMPEKAIGWHEPGRAEVYGLDADGDRKWDLVYFLRWKPDPSGSRFEYLVSAFGGEKRWVFSGAIEGWTQAGC